MEKGSSSRFYNSPCLLSALLLVALCLANCSSSPKASAQVEPAGPTPVLPAALPNLPPPPPIREVSPSVPVAVKVLSDGKEGNTQPSLIEASRMAKAKKREVGEARPVIEITDDNLRDYSNGGQVFVLESGESSNSNAVDQVAPTSADASEKAVGTENADQELFWRQSVSELRTGLRRTVDDLKRIDLESTLLRQQFYSETDPFVRDSEIKPRWDRALDQLSALRKKAKEDRSALAAMLTEAKKSGIAAEWLEDGSFELTDDETQLVNGPGATGQH